ncbi:MAG: HAMP domain-containing protein, partial [Deltaproteobacteria bacterium]|nr:HAMP domain-containing protein [Deltaproteobacteria bacterium]
MKMTLSKKMYGMIGIMSVVTLLVSGFAVYAIRSILGAYDTLVRVDVAKYSNAVEAEVALGKAVLATKNYMTRMEQDYADEFDKMIADMKGRVKAISKDADGPEKERLAKADKEIAEYDKKGKELIAMILTGKDAVTVDSEFKGIEVPLAGVLREMGEAALKSQKKNFERDASGARSTQLMFLVVALAGVALGWVFAIMTIRKITKSIAAVSEVTEKAAGGDLTQDVPVLTDDEVGNMALGFNKMMEDLRRIAGQIKGMTNTLASSSEEVSATTETLTKGAKDQSR